VRKRFSLPTARPPEEAEQEEQLRLRLQPFAAHLLRQEQREHALRYVAGLLSSLPRKTAETIAYLFDLDRHGLQRFLGISPWDWTPLAAELVRQVHAALAQPAGVIVACVEGFAKKGKDSVGTQRQCLDRSGKVGNGQVAVYLGYATAAGAALTDVRLYLPRGWVSARRRRKQCGVPGHVRYRTQAQFALEMLQERGLALPHAWVVADCLLGAVARFRQSMRDSGERYLVGVPPDTLLRWLGATRMAGRLYLPARNWVQGDSAVNWLHPAQGALPGADLLAARVVAQNGARHALPEETLLVIRQEPEPGKPVHEFYLSNACPSTPAEEFLTAIECARRVTASLRRARAEAGLADYEVRTWAGWHHHQTLALIAAWLLGQEPPPPAP
jgi:SRSO17 transposase